MAGLQRRITLFADEVAQFVAPSEFFQQPITLQKIIAREILIQRPDQASKDMAMDLVWNVPAYTFFTITTRGIPQNSAAIPAY